jgi:replicative DNA helicase
MDENVLKRVMPHSIEAEEAVIGAMLMDNETIVTAMEMLRESDFYGKQYGLVFRCISELKNSGQVVDLVTLNDKLKSTDAPPEMLSMSFLRSIYDNSATSEGIKYYAKIVRDMAIRRSLIRVNEAIANKCYSLGVNTEDVLAEAEAEIFKVLQSRNSCEITPIKEIVTRVFEKIEEAARNPGKITGTPSGYTDLDFQLSGFQPSDLILVAARPSMGKTAFVLNIVEHIAVRQKQKGACVVFSLEMSKEQLVNRLFAMRSGIDSQKLRMGQLADSDWIELVTTAAEVSDSNLIIDDTPGISVAELQSKCRKIKLKQDIALVAIDYLQLMSVSGNFGNRQAEISYISRGLKALAREIGAPVIALSQLSRGPESREDHRPRLSDLRESGAIEQDADVVMFIYRDDYYNKDTDKKNIAEIIVAKQRNGPIGSVELLWKPEVTRFVNILKQRSRNQ